MNQKSDRHFAPDRGGAETPGRAPRPRSGQLPVVGTLRAAIAGLLMGIANLIPGVSGGTMILALGLYEEFIESVAEVTALRFSPRRLLFLGTIGVFAAGAILGLAGAILYLLFHHPIAMFALFIGLTLGGAPPLLRLVRPIRVDVVIATLVGLGLMIGVFLLRSGSGMPHNPAMDFVSGVVGSTTMVLPGVSGSYMLLVLDQYERIVGAIDDLKKGLQGRGAGALKDCVKIIAPFGVGAVLGIVALSNVLKMLLRRYHRVTLGVLLGILLGSVIGLWPFNKAPSEKALERRTLSELRAFAATWQIPGYEAVSERESLAKHIAEYWERRGASSFTTGRVGTAMLMAVAGFLATYSLARGRPQRDNVPSET
jgi:putative membrane protein